MPHKSYAHMPSNGVIFIDLSDPNPRFMVMFLTANISKMVHFGDSHYRTLIGNHRQAISDLE